MIIFVFYYFYYTKPAINHKFLKFDLRNQIFLFYLNYLNIYWLKLMFDFLK